MGLPKGKTNNINGRPKGTSNKLSSETRTFLNAFLKKNRKKLQSDWDLLKPVERVQAFEKLLAYSIPKMNSMQIESLPDEQLNFIIELIYKNGKADN